MGDLKSFARKSMPSDIQQFASPLEEAERILGGEFSVKRQSSQTSDWFFQTSTRILSDVEKAEKSIGKNRNNEYISTITDLKMLAYLAMYHSQRLKVAVQYNFFDKTGDLASFDKAIEFESQAVRAYGNMVETAGNIYNMQLDFGSNIELFPGHWSKEYQRLQKELDTLQSVRKTAKGYEKQQLLLAHIPLQHVLLKDPILITATIRPENSIHSARVMYSTDKKVFSPVEMKFAADGSCSAEIPNPGEEVNLKYYLEITDKSGKKEYFPKNGANSPCIVTISSDREAPIAEVQRITTGTLNKELKVTAKVTDPSGVQRVSLQYRRVSQFEDYQSVKMIYNASSEQYEAVIPAQFFDGKYDVMYFIEAMDSKGNGRMYPDMDIETPYVIIHLDRPNN